MANADERALAWARALADDILKGREKDWLERVENTTVDVRCRACDRLFLTLEPEGSRAAVMPVGDPRDWRARFVIDAPRRDDGYRVINYERVKLLCPCGVKSPTVKANKLAREYLYALAGERDPIWPLD